MCVCVRGSVWEPRGLWVCVGCECGCWSIDLTPLNLESKAFYFNMICLTIFRQRNYYGGYTVKGC